MTTKKVIPFINKPAVVSVASGSTVTEAYSPSTYASVTGWWRGSYTGVPWVGSPSAGSSGGRNLIPGFTPSAGSSLDGYTPASFSGNTHLATTGVTTLQLVSASAYTIHILSKPADQPADIGNPSFQNGIFSDTNSALAINRKLNTFQIQHNTVERTAVTVPQGVWSHVTARFGRVAGELDVYVNSVLVSHVTSVPNIAGSGTQCWVASNPIESLFYNGDIMELYIQNAAASSGEISGFYRYLKSRYPSAGI